MKEKQLALLLFKKIHHNFPHPFFRRFTLKCMTPNCIARVARVRTPLAITAEQEEVGILMRKLLLQSYHPTPTALDPSLNYPLLDHHNLHQLHQPHLHHLLLILIATERI